MPEVEIIPLYGCPYCQDEDYQCELYDEYYENKIHTQVFEIITTNVSKPLKLSYVIQLYNSYLDNDIDTAFMYGEKSLHRIIQNKEQVNMDSFIREFTPELHCLRIEANKKHNYFKIYKYNRYPFGYDWESLDFKKAKKKMIADGKKINNFFCMNEDNEGKKEFQKEFPFKPKYFLETMDYNSMGDRVLYRFRPVLYRYRELDDISFNKEQHEVFDKIRGRYNRYYNKNTKIFGQKYTVVESIFFPGNGHSYESSCKNSENLIGRNKRDSRMDINRRDMGNLWGIRLNQTKHEFYTND